MSINWGGFEFESIKSLANWNPPDYGGIYAIMFKSDPENNPNRYKVLYFGETEKFSTRGINDTHHKYKCWKYHGYQRNLYVSIHRVYSDEIRKSREKQLIQKYTPECNEEFT